jgi:S1-C subfamily serine protease
VDLSVIGGEKAGTKLEPGPDGLVVGREDACDLVLDDKEVSRRHARLKPLPDGTVELEDLGSRNGTFVDGKQISGTVILRGGEKVEIGDTVISAAPVAPAAAPAAAKAPPPADKTIPLRRSPVAKGRDPKRSESAIQRLILQRSVNRLTWIAIGAGVLAAAAIVLIAIGAFSSDSEPPSNADIIEAVTPATVLVVDMDQDGTPIETGSGWVYDAEKGLIVTNAHVASGGSTFEVGTSADNLVPAKVLGAAPCDDLAVMKVEDTEGLTTLPLARQSEARQGDRVFVIGFPGNASVKDELQATAGVVSSVETSIDPELPTNFALPAYTNVVQTDAAINPGNSGGPLVNEDEELLGVNSVSGGENENQGYAIGVDRVKELVPMLAQGHSIGWFGFTIFNPAVGAGGTAEGLIVNRGQSVQGTEADDAGFGDIPGVVTSINDEPVNNPADYCEIVDDLDPGEAASIGVLLSTGESGSVSVKLEE